MSNKSQTNTGITKEMLDEFCTNIEDLEAKKKELTDEIKSYMETFAYNNQLTADSIKDYLKERKKILKDKSKYVLTDYETDSLLLVSFPELGSTGASDER